MAMALDMQCLQTGTIGGEQVAYIIINQHDLHSAEARRKPLHDGGIALWVALAQSGITWGGKAVCGRDGLMQAPALQDRINPAMRTIAENVNALAQRFDGFNQRRVSGDEVGLQVVTGPVNQTGEICGRMAVVDTMALAMFLQAACNPVEICERCAAQYAGSCTPDGSLVVVVKRVDDAIKVEQHGFRCWRVFKRFLLHSRALMPEIRFKWQILLKVLLATR